MRRLASRRACRPLPGARARRFTPAAIRSATRRAAVGHRSSRSTSRWRTSRRAAPRPAPRWRWRSPWSIAGSAPPRGSRRSRSSIRSASAHRPMSASATETAVVHGPWNPGIDSDPPWSLAPLSTIFQPENVFTGFDEAHELAHLTGLPVEDLVVFRPERLAVHEVLIRVTADLSVPDGPRVEDLGISFRRMTETILSRHVAPRMQEIVAKYEAAKRGLADVIEAELAATFAALASPPAAPKGGGWLGFLRRPARAAAASREDDQWTREELAI